MATVAQLTKGFRENVRDGIPTEMVYKDGTVYLNATHPRGQVGICCKPSLRQPLSEMGKFAAQIAAFQMINCGDCHFADDTRVGSGKTCCTFPREITIDADDICQSKRLGVPQGKILV